MNCFSSTFSENTRDYSEVLSEKYLRNSKRFFRDSDSSYVEIFRLEKREVKYTRTHQRQTEISRIPNISSCWFTSLPLEIWFRTSDNYRHWWHSDKQAAFIKDSILWIKNSFDKLKPTALTSKVDLAFYRNSEDKKRRSHSVNRDKASIEAFLTNERTYIRQTNDTSDRRHF